MAEVGVRELRDHLSEYLHRVRDGEEVVVTRRGTPVARIVGVTGHHVLDRLIRDSKVTPARQRRRRAPTPLKTKGTVSDLIADQRR